MTDQQPEALIRADELEAIGAESSLARAMAAHTIRLLYKENEALRAALAQRESVTQFSFQEYGPLNWGDSQVTKPEFVAEQKAMKEALIKRVVDGIPDMPIKVQYEREENYKNFAQSAQIIGIPQREWIGLTDEEYEAIREDGQFGKGSIRFKNLFEAIEAKLKEKNT